MLSLEQKRQALEKIAEEQGGDLTPDAVIEAAKNPANILHSCFDWDVNRAALENWRAVARGLIREVRVVIKTSLRQVSTVAYVRDPNRNHDEQGYIALTSVERRSAEANAIIDAELDRIIAAVNRARGVAEVLGVSSRFEKLLATVVEIKQELSEKVSAKRRARESAEVGAA